MNDKELLTLAAKAAGMFYPKWNEVHNYMMIGLGSDTKEWDPLTDDGDALRLAVKLKIDMEFGYRGVDANYYDSEKEGYTIKTRELFEDFTDPYAATRRAITKAAAEIGRGME